MEFPIICNDNLVDIFCKLKDLKDLVRCRCVSQQWNRLISNRCLHKQWNNLPINGLIFRSLMFPINDPGFFSSPYRWCDKWLSTSHENTHSMVYASLDGVVDDDEFDHAFLGMPNLNLMPCDHEIHAPDFLNCCNGLLLFASRRCFRYYVCNPTTKQCLPVPLRILASTQQKSEYVALAFDPSEALQFRIIRFTMSDTRFHPPGLDIFFSESRKWVRYSVNMKQDSGVDVNWSGFELLKHSTYLNGLLYRLSLTKKKLHFFDLRYLKFYYFIDLPRYQEAEAFKESVCIGVSKNSLHFCHSVWTVMHVWMLVDYDDLQDPTKSRWFLKYKISNQNWPDRLYSRFGYWFHGWIEPTAFHPHTDIVFIATPQMIFRYDLETEEIEPVYNLSKRLSISLPKYFPFFTFIHCPISFNNFNVR